MARGNEIIVSSEPRGVFKEGYIGAGLTPSPGTIMQLQAATALKGGRFTYELWAPGTDGQARPVHVLLEDHLQGRLATTAYAAGERCRLYVPADGEELNCLVKNLAGTADDHTKGEILMIDTGTGLLIATTGSPQSDTFQLLETITDPVADTLAWVQYIGA